MSKNRTLANLADYLDSAAAGGGITKRDNDFFIQSLTDSDIGGSPVTGFNDSSTIKGLITTSDIVQKGKKVTTTAGLKTILQGSINNFNPSVSATYDLGDSSNPLDEIILDSASSIFFGALSMTSVLSSGTSAIAVAAASYTWGGDRGVIGGGEEVSYSLTSEYISISTPGNSADFGDLTVARVLIAACSNSTYGLWVGGLSFTGSLPFNYWNTIDYLTFATNANGSDFGDLTVGRSRPTACSDGTYGVFGAGGADGDNATTNVIDYVTIATPGNATDFGDHTFAGWGTEMGAAADATYGLFAGGYVNDGVSSYNNTAIDYVTIATPGNASDFGDLTSRTSGGRRVGGLSNDTYALFFGGSSSSNVIDYVTITTPGNAIDFGDLNSSNDGYACGCSDNTYGVIQTSTGGGGSNTSAIDYVTIATPGNASDFGNLGSDDHNRYAAAAASGSPS